MDSEARKGYLDYVARCRQAFTPFAPIELPDFFAGRKDVVEDILAELQAPGRQVAIYGERGVGKTSLAQLLYFFANYDDERVHVFRCSAETKFDDICMDLVSRGPASYVVKEVRMESSRGFKGAISPFAAERTTKKSVAYRNITESRSITPTRMLDAFAGSEALLIIDEYDRVGDRETNVKMAELIKHFSDARSKTKIVIVGVADTLTQLIGEHESLSRSLAQIKLDRMNDSDLLDIIDRGANRIGVRVDRALSRKTVALADGFPHFVHLTWLYTSLAAGEQLRVDATAIPVVDEAAYRKGVGSALDKAEHSLHEAYDAAVITTHRKSDIYELVLRSMSMSEKRDVQVQELARHASFLESHELRPAKFSQALGRLIKPERGEILTKVRVGYYKFTNPLMRAYLRCRLEYENITQHGGQLVFPFLDGR